MPELIARLHIRTKLRVIGKGRFRKGRGATKGAIRSVRSPVRLNRRNGYPGPKHLDSPFLATVGDPVDQSIVHRDIWCGYYDDCLSLASSAWPSADDGWTCKGCAVAILPSVKRK